MNTNVIICKTSGSTSPSTHIPSSTGIEIRDKSIHVHDKEEHCLSSLCSHRFTDNSVAVQEVEEEDIQQVDEHARLFEGMH